jgi:predicted nuclease of predicted toxin-antitoxin system
MNVPARRWWLRDQGHEVFSVFGEAKGVSDDELLTLAVAESRILITNDKDFGEMIFRERREHRGIIFLRLDDERSANKIEVLRHLLEGYSEKLHDRFVTVTETKVRFAS